ncbi:MAG TPA: helicase-associated domain-containing protein [Streptosporangiaceae bacterium]
MGGTSMPAWLATLEQGELAEVLAVRADVCGPTEPGGWDELADRLQQRQSVGQALKRLARPDLQVAEAAAALGPDATRETIAKLLSGPKDPNDPSDHPWDDRVPDYVYDAVDDALMTLEEHALVWPGPGEVLHVAETLAEALREREPARRPAAGRARFDLFPPEPPTTVLADPEKVDLTAAAQLGTFLGQVEGMLAECARRPLQVFKVAGMKPAALGRVMRAARCDEASARLAVACARRAGVLVSDGTHVRLAPACDAFTPLPPGEQAARLLLAWWRLPSAPTRTHSDDGGQLHPLSPKAVCAGCVQVRHKLVAILRRLPEGEGVPAREDVAAALVWWRPLACDHSLGHPPHSALLEEARLLGVVAHGVLSSFGALLADGDHAGLAQEASRLLPPFAEHAEIAPRHMATVRGTPSRRLAKTLDAVADRQFGPVWQISHESLRRAWESGLSAADIEASLAAISAAPLPASLRSRIAAAAGGRVPPPRLAEVPATCVFRSADTALLARIAGDPAMQAIGVRQLSPGILIATGPRDSVLAALRAAGYAAVEDPVPGPLPPLAADEPAPDFGALAERLRREPHVPSRSRARPPRRPLRQPRSAASRPARPARPRTALERAEGVITRGSRELDSNEIRLLAQAVAADRRVRITYVSREGEETDRDISPPYEIVDGKLLKAICEMRSAQTGRPEERMFNLARIQSVQPVDD